MQDPLETRRRFVSDLQAGRTIALTNSDLADPELRKHLPILLEELQREHCESKPLHVRGYTVLGEIARGGMSTVYLAKQDLLGRHVALKVVPSVLEGTARSRERTMREARAMAALSHPNIVAVHEVVDTGEVLALAMDWIDGLTLAQLLQALPQQQDEGDLDKIAAMLGDPTIDDPFGTRDLTATTWMVRVIRDIAMAVQRVHDAGMLHLDIKPSNILVRRDGTPMLADFGVVREIDLYLTGTRSFAGTPIYAAPEQFQSRGAALTPTTDVYGLGITLYEALARAKPIDEGSLSRILRDLESGRIPRLSERCQVPADLETIVHKAIDPDPTRRYPSAAAMAADLTAFLEHRPITARPWTRLERLRRRAKAEPWKAIAAAVIVATVPVAAGLGVKLMVELPRLQALDATMARRQAMAIVHRVFLDTLQIAANLNSPVSQLDEAVRLAPTDPVVLGSRVVLGASADFAAAHRLLADSPTTPRHLSLQMLRDRAGARELRFTREQTQRLLDSPDPVDMALVTMDRIIWLRLGGSDSVIRSSLEWLDRARLNSAEADPLLHGVTAYLAGIQGDRAKVDACVTAIERLWPDDVEILMWGPLAYEQLDPQACLERLRDLEERFPDSETVQLRIAEQLWASGRYDEHRQLAATMSPRWRRRMEIGMAAKSGERERVRALCAELAADDGETPERKASLLLRFAPELSGPPILRAMAVDAPDPTFLAQAAKSQLDPEMQRAVLGGLDRLLAAKPPAAAAIALTYSICNALRELEHCAPAIAALPDIDDLPESCLRFACEILRNAKDWTNLERFATQAFEHAKSDQTKAVAAFHLGIAAARLGDDEAAMRWFDQQKAASGKPYFEVFQEQARYFASPDTPADRRDQGRAMKLCDDLDRQLQGRGIPRSPWFGAIRAEVEFANGLPKEALRTAQEALQLQRRGKQAWIDEKIMGYWSAPADVEARLEAAIARYRAAVDAADAAPKGR